MARELLRVNKFLLFVVRLFILLKHRRLSLWYLDKEGFGRLPNPALPRTLNDKYFWRKVFDRAPVFTRISDKILVREWLKVQNIDVQSPEILWTGTRPEDIPDTLLTNGVVVKANHGSGTNVMLEAPPADREAFNERLHRYLRKDYGRKKLEWAYFDIERRILVERRIPNINAEFKFYTFGERLERLVMIHDRFEEISADIWVPDGKGGWALENEKAMVSSRQGNKPLPQSMEAAEALAREIGKRFDHMRVDILTDGKEIWFSEVTIYSMAGYFRSGIGDDPEHRMNLAWSLSDSWFMKTKQTGWRKWYKRALESTGDVTGRTAPQGLYGHTTHRDQALLAEHD